MLNKIKSAIMEFPNGKSVDMKKYVNLPVTWESTLDETHGTGTVLMTDLRQADFEPYGVNIEQPFPVFTPLEISFENQNKVIRMIVARDTAEMVRKDGFPTWSHNLQLVEETKRLEFEPVDNLTFKNPVSRMFDADSDAVWNCEYTTAQHEDWLPSKPANGWSPPAIKSILTQKGTLKISDNASLFDMNNNTLVPYNSYELKEIALMVLFPNGKTTNYTSTPKKSGTDINAPYLDTSFLIDLNMEGEYFFEFNIKFNNLTSGAGITITRRHAYRASTYVYVGADAKEEYKSYTIKNVLDRLLAVTPTRTIYEDNKYTFRNNAEEYANEESPEFTFTGKHLFEALLDIASYKKMFPALYKNEIYFRPFWNGLTFTSDELPPPYKAFMNSAIDQYCTALDSYAENVVCINDSNVGSVVEPYASGYISGRSASGSAITETTAVAPTLSPIYQTHGLEVFADGIEVGDIQAYLYETEDYEALSDTSAAYPYSKAYAIKYTRFSPNFTELSHRIEGSNSIAAAFIRPVLANIVGAVSDASVGIGLQEYLSQYVSDSSSKSSAFAEVLFRPTYTPVVNARFRQYKPFFDTTIPQATLFYNQQAEVVDSEALGEHLKGLVQKLGNTTEIRLYTFPTIDKVPTVGTIIDGKSVYSVAVTIFETHVQATICLVEYAELSKFIGVKNEIKTSDISTTKWAKRFVNWEEFFVFTHDATLKTNSYSITEHALEAVVTFDYKNPLTCAMFTTYTQEGVEIVTAFSPVKHLAIGNSIYFQFETMDNFAVCYQSEEAPLEAKSVIDGKRFDRAQKAVRYCDTLGRAETVSFKLLTDGANASNSTYVLTEDDIQEITADTEAQTLTVKLRKAYPFYIRVSAFGDKWYDIVFSPNETSKTVSYTGGTTISPIMIATDKSTDESINAINLFIQSTLAHEYPKKPYRVDFDESKVMKAFAVDDLLIKKNSAECLKFACQYHFRTTERNFIIGSGMSNFSSLIGGECDGLALFVGSVNVNPFERHINTSFFAQLNALPTFKRSNARVIITLPDEIETIPAKSWAFCGKDKNGNWQLIFGENKQSLNDNFNKTLYLVCRAKN